jgi:phage-related protein
MFFNIAYYTDATGESPVAKSIMALSARQQVKVFFHIDYLAEYGYRARRPFADYLGSGMGLYELRPAPCRVLYYYYSGQTIVLLHLFEKRSQAIPESEIRIALKRKQDFSERKPI